MQKYILYFGFLFGTVYANQNLDVNESNVKAALAKVESAEELLASFGDLTKTEQSQNSVDSILNSVEVSKKTEEEKQENMSTTVPPEGKKGAPPQRYRTCAQALESMLKEGTCIIDLSNVSDFVQNGEKVISAYYEKIKQTNAFGTHSNNVYINVTEITVAKFAGEFAKDKRTVIWNLSHNRSIDDTVIDALSASFQSVYSLNLSDTNLTDVGLAKIVSAIKTNGLGELIVINVSKTKVTAEGVENLRASMREALEKWKQANPGESRNLQGDDGVIFMSKAKNQSQPQKAEISAIEQAEKILQENLKEEDKTTTTEVAKEAVSELANEAVNQVSDQGVKSEVPEKEVDEIEAILSQYAAKSTEEL